MSTPAVIGYGAAKPLQRESRIRFTVVDGLRGIASLSVVLFHAATAGHADPVLNQFPSWIRQLFLLGENGVAIFFVLSGFVIAHSLFDRQMSGRQFAQFTMRRSARLDPPYWVSIILAISFAYLSTKIVYGKAEANYSVKQIVAHLFYLQDIIGYPEIETVYWTLCLEIQFYLIYGLMTFASKRTPFLIAGACVVSSFWPLTDDPKIFAGLFLPLWYTFLLGVAAYWAWRKPKAAPLFLSFAIVILFVGCMHHAYFTIVAALTSLLLYFCAVRQKLTSSLNWQWLQFLGLISYSLYLTHNVVTGAVFRIGKIAFPLSNPAIDFVWLVISVATSIAAASVFWLVVEKPSLRLSAWFGTIGAKETMGAYNT